MGNEQTSYLVTGLLLLVSIISAGCSDRSAADGPSVVVITLDTTRADRLGCYGYEAASTPRIDALAAGGVVFDQARTSVPLTLPAHASIFTATYPPYHGIRENGMASLGEDAETLAEVLQERGWETGAFVSSFVLDRQFGLDQGFDHYDQLLPTQLVSGGLLQERSADEAVDAAITWLEEVDSPFFLWLHLFDPHVPYLPPEPYRSRFSDSPYDGEIAFVDEQVGRLLDALGERSDPDEIIIVLTSDHGESLMEHGEETHGVYVYDSSIRVPLILAGEDLPEARRISESVSVVDIMPTILDLLGITGSSQVQGESMMDLVQGEGGERKPTYFESYYGFLSNGWSPLVGLTNGRDKIIDAPSPEYFNLQDDPGETENIIATDEERAGRMREASRAFWSELQNDNPFARAREVSGEERRTLEQLGYVVGEPSTGPLPYADPALADPKDRKSIQKARNLALGYLMEFQQGGQRERRLLDQAVEVLAEALVQDPRAALLHEYAGTAQLFRGEYAEAVSHFRQCLARRPERVDARFNLALALIELGDRSLGLRELERCLEIQPDFVKAAQYLGMLNEQDGKFREAEKNWEYFLDRWKGGAGWRNAAEKHLKRIRRVLNQKKEP